MKKILLSLIVLTTLSITLAHAQIQSGRYYRARHLYTYGQRYLSVTGKTQTRVGFKGRELASTTMVSDSAQLSNPATVLFIEGTANGEGGMDDVTITGQGVSTYDITHRYLSLGKEESGYTAFFGYEDIFPIYVKDYGNKGAVIFRGETDQYWDIQPLDEDHIDTFYFGVAPKLNAGGSYYTTLYTTFPYKLEDGVKAYYVKAYTSGSAVDLTEINDSIIPSNTPVILECTKPYAKGNRLVPSLTEPTDTAWKSSNILKPVLDLYNGNSDESTYRTSGGDDKLILAVSNNKLVFQESDSTNYLDNNTVYLPASALTSSTPAKSFGRTTGISGVKSTAAKSGDATVYDLQGRKVSKPGKGIYIVNGKKVAF